MAPRLLSLLTLIESALQIQESSSLSKPTTRTVNFDKGLARLTFGDGSGSILVQSFVLADGQTCVKALLNWTGSDFVGSHSLYPQGSYNWAEAGDRVAEIWNDGPPKRPVGEDMLSADEVSAMSRLGATG